MLSEVPPERKFLAWEGRSVYNERRIQNATQKELPMGREFELKFQASRQQFLAIRQAFPQLSPIVMETTYYDTPGDSLSRRNWMLRKRMENGTAVCTLKTPLPDGSRGEWEVACDNIRLAVSELCKLKGSQELWELVHTGLQERCGARFTRLAAKIPVEGGEVELALDDGILFGGRRSMPLLEVEVELKEGREEAALAFAAKLIREYGLVPEKRSKHQRALALTKEKQE